MKYYRHLLKCPRCPATWDGSKLSPLQNHIIPAHTKLVFGRGKNKRVRECEGSGQEVMVTHYRGLEPAWNMDYRL